MPKKRQKQEKFEIDELIMPDGSRLKVGSGAVRTSGGNASSAEVIEILRNAAKKNIFPPPPDLADLPY